MRWVNRPALHNPVLVTAFSGWNDAGDAASSALRYLIDQLDAEPVGSIDGDEFYDFTETRPTVSLSEGRTRSITWPAVELFAASVAGHNNDPHAGDLLLAVGPEPQLRWRSFCALMTSVAHDLGISRALHMGALLAEVPHTRPVPMVGSGPDPTFLAAQGLTASTYEGPTGIVGVLHDACQRAGMAATSLWATVPTYVSGAPSPKAALALVSHAARILHVPVALDLLEIATEAYEREVDALVADDDDTAGYVRRLEMSHDLGSDDLDGSEDDDGLDDMPEIGEGAAAHLADEIERFLRGHQE